MSDSDDSLCLSQESIAALLEHFSGKSESFYAQFSNEDNVMKSSDLDENWQLSQFWYDDFTATSLVEEALDQIQYCGNIALIGCPSLYYFFKRKSLDLVDVKLFDIDKRFEMYKNDFICYDYNELLTSQVPSEWKNHFDIVLMDPPFLSEECLTKCSDLAKFLTKCKIITCTGAVMEPLVQKILIAQRTTFVPTHKHNLGNEFACFINYQSKKLKISS